MLNIALMGYGVIGSGVAKVIEENKKLIASRLGEEVYLKYILEIRDMSGTPYADRVVTDLNVILNDPEVKVVVEVMGGIHPASDFTRAALEAGKSVVTANKAVVADCGDELLALAREKGVRYLFEASVGGGIPIIRPLINDLASNEIEGICGILNGTTNYILTRMTNEGCTYAEVLKDAQKLGYAEANPAADVEGTDALRKTAILAALSYGKLIPMDMLKAKGITDVSLTDIEVAETFGCSVKLIGRAGKLEDGRIYATVSPEFVKESCPMAHVNDVFNSVLVRGNMLGDAMFYGRGAGQLPTAGAVVADVIDALETKSAAPARLFWEKATEADVVPADEVIGAVANEFCHIFEDGETLKKAVEGKIDVSFVNGTDELFAVICSDPVLEGSVKTYAVLS
ncbi:MAG: homoserine dehydrogenase [Clostridia bacterium]|nr:homoserine dehydrogenase [Clostridia bacterium]